MRRKRDLAGILDRLDPDASLAERHLWAVELIDWIRGRGATPQAAVSRVQLLIDALDAQPDKRALLRAWWTRLVATVDFTALLADYGFAPRTAFMSELAERLRRKLLPVSPETIDAGELFALLLSDPRDVHWIAALDDTQLARLGALFAIEDPAAAMAPGLTAWQRTLLDAIVYCTAQAVATGFAPEVRLRMSAAARATRPFRSLAQDVETLRREVVRLPRDGPQLEDAALRLRDRLDGCRQAVSTVYAHLEDNGISVGLVFRLRQLRERLLRIRELLDCLLSGQPQAATGRLLARLAAMGPERRSIRALIASNSSLLASKVAERSAETGEHYITRDRAAYGRMLRQAAGGGVLTAGTVLGKFAITALALSPFWNGVWSSVLYAGSFVLIQLLHCTLATKQPAMTAPAMAAKLKELGSGRAVDEFVDEVTHLVRSQVAAVLGNVLTAFPAVLLVGIGLKAALGHPMIPVKEAHHVLESLTLLGPTALFAAFTGVLLFSASIMAGWAENWFVLHRLGSAIEYNPRITRWLGADRARRWAHFMRDNVSGFASNISLGVMLGMLPPLLAFVGIGLEARHVTLSTGQIAGAASVYGLAVVQNPAFWWCLAAIPVIGALNLVVSFLFAFRLALRAHNVGRVDRLRIRAAIWTRWRDAPLSFFVPRGDGARRADPPPPPPDRIEPH